MNSIDTKSTNVRLRLIAATMLAAAGAVIAGMFGSAAPAGALPGSGELHTAIAFSPVTGTWAQWVNGTSFVEASTGALNACSDAGGRGCLLVGSASDKCLALSVDAVHWLKFRNGTGPSQISAMTAALDANHGGRIATVGCVGPGGPDRAFTGVVNQLQP